jgi:hypothetical protein
MADGSTSNGTDASTEASATSSPESSATVRRWIVGALLALFFGIVMYQVLNPFPDQAYMEISHGDHVHYVPKDRDPDVPLNRFPTTPPAENERILPDGQVVPKQ